MLQLAVHWQCNSKQWFTTPLCRKDAGKARRGYGSVFFEEIHVRGLCWGVHFPGNMKIWNLHGNNCEVKRLRRFGLNGRRYSLTLSQQWFSSPVPCQYTFPGHSSTLHVSLNSQWRNPMTMKSHSVGWHTRAKIILSKHAKGWKERFVYSDYTENVRIFQVYSFFNQQTDISYTDKRWQK